MKRLSIIVLLLALFSAGCGYKEGAATPAQKSYFYFSGNTEGVMISIDGGQKFGVAAGKNNLYSIKPGSHTIEIFRGDLKILDRTLFLSDGIAKEIEIQ